MSCETGACQGSIKVGFRKRNRRQKVNALAKFVDERIYTLLSGYDRQWWIRTAVEIKINPPSEETIKDVLSRFRRRSRRRLKIS